MGEITNMIIRMRELAVQMNNGVYTDSDRQNAQLEVTALLSEIDKIATNTAFNDVKVLDGSYNADIRAGNTNSEIIGITVKRMNTDSLGGNTIATDSQSIAESANIDTAAYRATKSVMNLTATESSNVIIKEADLSTEMVNFASGRTGTYSMAGTDSALFNVVTAADGTTTFETQEALNFVATDSNSYSFSVTFTDGTTGETFTDELTMAVVDNTAASTVKASRSTLAVSESQGIRFNAVDTTLDPADATNNSGDGDLSTSLQTFVISDTATDGTVRGTFSIEGADVPTSVSAAGEVTAALDFDNQDSSAGTDAYSFNVVYTSAAGDRFVEAVTLNVTDSNEEVYSVNAPSIPSAVKTGDTFSIAVNDGTGSTTITATVAADSAAYGATDVAAALNQANQVLAAPVGVTFGVDSNGNITTTYDDALGDIADRRVVNLAESGTSMATNLAAASSGASFSITIGSGTTSTYTARLDADAAAGSYAIADLVSDLNSVDKSSFTDANKVTFSVGDDGTSIDVKFDSQGTNTTTVGRLQYDEDGAPAAAVAREVLFKGSDLASAIAATTSGDTFVLTVNDGTSATTYTYSMGASTATVGELVTNLQGATVGNSGAARLVVFSVDNGQLKVSQAAGGASANDFTVTLAFNDNDGTASETFSNPQVVTAGVASLGGATAAVNSSAAGSESVAGFSAQALQYNAIAYGTGTVSTTTTGADAINQVITIDNDATSGGSTLAAAVGAATAGETFSVTIGGNSGTGAIYNVTVGAAYSTAGDYTLDALASDLTSATRVATTARAAKFDLDSTNVGTVVTALGNASAGDIITVLVSDGTSSQSYTVTLSAGSATVSNVTELASLIETEAVASGANALHQVTFYANNGTLQATFDMTGASANTKTITMAFTDNAGGLGFAANGADLIQAGQDAGALNVFNDATFSVVAGDLVATLAYDGAVPTANTDSAAVGRVNYVNSSSEEILVGSSATITTAGVNAVNRVDTVATPSLGAEDFAAGDVLSITVGANTLSHTLTAGEAADMTSASDGGKIAKIATHLSNAASDASASLTFSGVGNDLRVTFDTAGVNTDGVSQLNIDRAEVTKGTATKVSDGVNSLKAYDSTDDETGAVASNSADYGRNNTSTGNNTDEVATAQLGGSYAAGSGATTIAATSTITNIVEAAKVQIGLDVLGSDFAAFRAANPTGNYTVGGTDGEKFQVSKDGVITNRAPMDFETTPNFSFEVTYTATNGDTFTENVNLQLSNSNADSGDHLINVSVATQAFAGDSIAILDTALNQVSAAQAELGAIQNRLSHNIDNLTKGSMLTETSRGRIVDADFASETTQLSKQQILAQAATSMLAQANQSKQSVLALQ